MTTCEIGLFTALWLNVRSGYSVCWRWCSDWVIHCAVVGCKIGLFIVLWLHADVGLIIVLWLQNYINVCDVQLLFSLQVFN